MREVNMRRLWLVAPIVIAGCAAARPPAEDAAAQKAMAERIDQICSLPKSEQDAAIAKLKEETGMVLYCGQEK
jgi:hypothetical protein